MSFIDYEKLADKAAERLRAARTKSRNGRISNLQYLRITQEVARGAASLNETALKSVVGKLRKKLRDRSAVKRAAASIAKKRAEASQALRDRIAR